MSKTALSAKRIPFLTARQLLLIFAVVDAASTYLFFLANKKYPYHIVLGNHVMGEMWSLFLSVGLISLLSLGLAPMIEWVAEHVKFKLNNRDWVVLYFFINFAAIWLVSRYAEWVGLGIDSWPVVAVLSLALVAIQAVTAGVISRLKLHR